MSTFNRHSDLDGLLRRELVEERLDVGGKEVSLAVGLRSIASTKVKGGDVNVSGSRGKSLRNMLRNDELVRNRLVRISLEKILRRGGGLIDCDSKEGLSPSGIGLGADDNSTRTSVVVQQVILINVSTILGLVGVKGQTAIGFLALVVDVIGKDVLLIIGDVSKVVRFRDEEVTGGRKTEASTNDVGKTSLAIASKNISITTSDGGGVVVPFADKVREGKGFRDSDDTIGDSAQIIGGNTNGLDLRIDREGHINVRSDGNRVDSGFVVADGNTTRVREGVFAVRLNII